MVKKTNYFIEINGSRPDYRRIKAFLWSDDKKVNSDGNAKNPASKDWTELTLMTREPPFERVDVFLHQKTPLILRVSSEDATLAAKLTYILAKEANGKVSKHTAEEFFDFEVLSDDIEKTFNLQEALNRFDNSIFSKTTIENPFPK